MTLATAVGLKGLRVPHRTAVSVQVCTACKSCERSVACDAVCLFKADVSRNPGMNHGSKHLLSMPLNRSQRPFPWLCMLDASVP
jgi:hypothetical protein